MQNPANAGRRQGSSKVVCFPARDLEGHSPTIALPQCLAVHRLVRRFNLPPATAAAVAHLAFGETRS